MVPSMVLVAASLLALAVGVATAQPPTKITECSSNLKVGACDEIISSMGFGVMNHSAPGIAASAVRYHADGTTSTFVGNAGRFTYEEWQSVVTDGSLYDMASCSKIIATTTATAQLYQRGFLDITMRVADSKLLGPAFGASAPGKNDIIVRNLLLHNAGYPPDPNPGYSSPLFPCRQNAKYYPAQEFSCNHQILDNLIYNQTLVYAPGSKFIYSDLSFITLMYVVGRVVQQNMDALLPKKADGSFDFPPVCFGNEDLLECLFYAYVHHNVFRRYGMPDTVYVPSSTVNQCLPQWSDPWYHHGLIMGYVSDQNAFAMGGISGHAGVFSNVRDATRFMEVWMQEKDPMFLNKTTIKLFTTVYNLTQSSRAFGWDTNDQPYKWCGKMSLKTFFHIGYTGTQLCGDPVNNVSTVLLANGRYPDYKKDGMIWYRPEYNSLALDQMLKKP